MSVTEVENLLSVPEAAKCLGISPNTLNCWVSQRRIAYTKIGRRTMFKPSELNSFINAGEVMPRSTRDKPSGKPILN
jgi:excisionase family DNA binding protein